MSVELSTLALQATGGFVTGTLIGYALRKAVKVALTVLGLWLLSIVSLSYVGIVTVNWAALNELVAKAIGWLGMSSENIASFISSAGVFGLTLSIGFFTGAGFLHTANFQRKFYFVKRKSNLNKNKDQLKTS